jgi:urease accessory protein UreH
LIQRAAVAADLRNNFICLFQFLAQCIISGGCPCTVKDGWMVIRIAVDLHLHLDVMTAGPVLGICRIARFVGSLTVLAALYVITQQFPIGALVDRLHHCLATQSEVLAGVSELPNNCGAVVRVLGHTSMAVEAAMRQAWNEARLALLDIPAPDLRKM